MEVGLLKEPNDNIKKPVLLSKCSRSPTVSRPADLIVAKNDQVTEKCQHFTIRGFVAEIRKRDRNKCSPFHALHDCTLDEYSNLLPPLSVRKFRWWRCQSCLHKNIDPETTNAAIMNIQNDKEKNGSSLLHVNDALAFHPGKTKSSFCLPRPSEGKVLQGRLVQVDSSRKKDGAPLNLDLIKRGAKHSKYGFSRPVRDQNRSGKLIHMATKRGACRKGEIGKQNVVHSANISKIVLPSENTPNIVSSKQKETQYLRRTHGPEVCDKMISFTSIGVGTSGHKDDRGVAQTGKMKEIHAIMARECGMPLEGDVHVPRDDDVLAISARPSGHHSKYLEKGSRAPSDIFRDLTDTVVKNHDDPMKSAVSVGKLQNKKARKVRSLDDIIRNEELRKTEEVCISNGDGVISRNDDNMSPDAVREVDPHLTYKSHLFMQNAQEKPKKTKNTTEAVPNCVEEPSLIHWLKKVPKKASRHKGIAQPKNMHTAEDMVQFAAVKDLDLNLEYCEEGREKQEITAEKKQKIMSEFEAVKPSLILQRDSTAWKDQVTPKSLITKHYHSGNAHSKSRGIIVSEKGQHHRLDNQDKSLEKFLLSSNRNKRALFEAGDVSQKHYSMKQRGSQVQEKAIKKRRTTWTCQREVGDDIPMDIVELLAKNQHERRLMNDNADSGKISNLLEITETAQVGKGWKITGWHENEVSNTAPRGYSQKQSQPKITGYGARTPVKNNGDAECRLKTFDSSRKNKQSQHIDLYQQAPSCDYTRSHAFSRYCGLSMSGPQLSVIDSNRSCSPQTFYWNDMNLLASGLHCMDLATCSQNPLSKAHDSSSVLLNDLPSGIASRKKDAVFDLKNVFLEGKPQAVAHLPNSKDSGQSSISERSSAAKSLAEADKGYHSQMMGPADLYTNETISALNLLRLMDRAACAGELHNPSKHNSRGFTHVPNCQDNVWHATEVGVKSREILRSPITVENSEGDQQLQNHCKPVRPLPRVGILGPLLQKEIVTSSKKSRVSFGLRDAIEQHSYTPTYVLTAPNLNFRDECPKRSSFAVNCFPEPGCSLPSVSDGQLGNSNVDKAVQPFESNSKMEYCVVNRNPADFAMPDDDSEYMIEPRYRDIGPSRSPHRSNHLDGQKRQKVKKLSDLKGSKKC